MVVIDIPISLAELERLLDGGGDDDWINLIRVRFERNGVRFDARDMNGNQVWSRNLGVGDSVTFQWKFNISA